MKKICLGILAHVDAGKTTLSEALLYETGTIRKIGRVDNKDAFLDTDNMEKERGITIFSKIARLNVSDKEFVLVDTPGHVDFSTEMERSLNVLDAAILLINASDGVQGHTKTVWKLLKAHNIPTVLFVNKMDLPDTDKESILAKLKQDLSGEVVDFTNEGTDEFYEDIATGSDELLDYYMNNGVIETDSIKKAVLKRLIFPVFWGSALKLTGIKELLEGLYKYIEAPSYGSEFGALCYKISKDKSGNRLTHLKITGGVIKAREMINGDKINEIRLYSGDRYETCKEAYAGDIVAITGIKESKPGDVYGVMKSVKASVLEPVITYAVRYPDTLDALTMHKYMLELEEEEPSLQVEYSEKTREIYVHLMGEVQTEILKQQIKDRFDIDVSFGTGRILYRETICDVVEGVGHFEPLRHYAEVHLKLEPLETGSGLEFDTDVSEEVLAINWQRLIMTHLKEREYRGVLTGSPITDMRITIVAGRAHQKHTEGGDFRQATYRAVRHGLMQAESKLLEPFYFYELIVPDNCVGRAMTDIDRMWGNATVTEQNGGMSTITGTAPVSTMNGYLKEVLMYTKGMGSMTVSLAGYEPCHNAEEVIAARNYDPEADIKNTADSVFCSHGAGTVVPWYEVHEYMHIPFVIYENDVSEDEPVYINRPEKAEVFVTTEEIDDIMNKTFYANRNGRKGAYKGISKALRERQRIGGHKIETPVVYKGTKIRDKYMLIDGYNVVHAWPELSDLASRDINAAAGRLIDIVMNYQGMTGVDTILVFDAYKVPGHNTEVYEYGKLKVVYTKTSETADRYIERYAHANGSKYDITVVTSDGVEQVIIRGEGCMLMSSRDFIEDVDRKSRELRENKNLWSFD